MVVDDHENFSETLTWHLKTYFIVNVLSYEEMDSLFQQNDWSVNARLTYQIYLV